MNFDEYQIEANRTVNRNAEVPSLVVAALGLYGESGEVADMVKKHFGQGHPLDKEKFVKELGDVLWYLAVAATAAGVALSHVAEMNREKLRERYPDGFEVGRSVNR
jgi:NTP pyrophosphatase (non-canonical NTP hydrolase)